MGQNKFKKLKISEIKKLLNFQSKRNYHNRHKQTLQIRKILGKFNHNRLKIITKILILKKKMKFIMRSYFKLIKKKS